MSKIYCNHCDTWSEARTTNNEHNDELLQCSECGSMDVLLEHEHYTLYRALEKGEERAEKVEINDFIVFLLGKEYINEILKDFIEKTPILYDDIVDYLDL